MNKAEDMTLADNTLPHDAVVLYVRCFRRFMSYQTGEAFISMPRMAEALRYEPNPRSKEKPSQPSPRRVRTLIAHLERVGLISKVQSGNITSGLSATYKCILATVDNLNEHRHDTDTVDRHGQGHSQRHGETRENKGLEAAQRHGQRLVQRHGINEEQRHISVISDLEEEDMRVCTREQLTFGENAKAIAKSVGLNLDEEHLKAKFEYWKTGQGYRVQDQIYNHNAKWRSYCAAIRAKQFEKPTNQQQAKPHGKQNGTASLLAKAKAHSERNNESE